MAKLIVNVPKALKVRVTKNLRDIVKDPVILNEVGKFTQELIVANARLGKTQEGSKSRARKLPKLSDSYQAVRKGELYFRTIGGKKGRAVAFKGKDPKLSRVDKEFFRPNQSRSNVTFTGQFLKSIRYARLLSGKSRGRIAVFPTGRRSDGIRNIQIIRWLTQLNKRYEIFGINQSGIKQIRKIFERGLRRKLKRKR